MLLLSPNQKKALELAYKLVNSQGEFRTNDGERLDTRGLANVILDYMFDDERVITRDQYDAHARQCVSEALNR